MLSSRPVLPVGPPSQCSSRSVVSHRTPLRWWCDKPWVTRVVHFDLDHWSPSCVDDDRRDANHGAQGRSKSPSRKRYQKRMPKRYCPPITLRSSQLDVSSTGRSAPANRPAPDFPRTKRKALCHGRTPWWKGTENPQHAPTNGGMAAWKAALQHAARPISRPAADAPLLPRIVGRVDGDLPEPLIGVGLRIIRDRVGVPQIFADVLERFHLLLPGLGEIGFAAGPLRDSFEDVARDGVLIHFGGGDHVERNALVLGHGAYVD